ncbi:MAG: GLUG motif-containing protein, partial [Thermoplasmata archaeon]
MKRKIFTASLAAMILTSGLLVTLGSGEINSKYFLNEPSGENFNQDRSGTPEDPYIVHNVDNLQKIIEDPDSHYALGNDIDANETSSWNGGDGFEPLGTETKRFTGGLDGKNYTITGLYINRSGMDYVGLFGYVDSGGQVKNVHVEDVNITGMNHVGGIVGYNGGTVENSYATGNITGNDYVGGLMGSNCHTVSNSSTDVEVSGNERVGGLIGVSIGTVEFSFATGTITGNNDIGGLVGGNIEIGSITNCYSSSNTTGGGWIGLRLLASGPRNGLGEIEQ